MSPKASAAREQFVAEFQICATSGRLYGLDELVASVARSWHISRTPIRAFLTSPEGQAFLRSHAGDTPASIAYNLPGDVILAGFVRR